MASNEQRRIPLEIEDTNCKQRQEEIVDEQDPSNDPVQVKSPSRPRPKVVITGAVIIVIVIVTVAAVLIGTFVSSNDKNSNNGKNKKATTVKSSPSLSHFSAEAPIIKSSASLSHFSAEATIVKSSPSATKSFEVTPYTPSTTTFLNVTSTFLVLLSSTDVPSASTMFRGTTLPPSNTKSPIASSANSSLSSS